MKQFTAQISVTGSAVDQESFESALSSSLKDFEWDYEDGPEELIDEEEEEEDE